MLVGGYMAQQNFEFLELSRKAPKERWAPERVEDFNEIQGNYSANEAKLQASRCLDCGTPYCQFKCPVQNYIPQWLSLVEEGRILEAATLSHQTNSLPEICGRVCPQDRLCEGSCTLDEDFGAVSIGAIEKYITDTALAMGWKPEIADIAKTGKKVAIIGAGPAGLACADILTQHGITAVVYDKHPEIGGLLSFGIPSFKLEKDVVVKRRKILEYMGVEFKLNTEVGKDISFDVLYQQYDAVFIAVGCYKNMRANIPGEHLKGVYQALDYLINNNHKQMGLIDKAAHHDFYFKRVLVLGGGDTAMDCARTAVRQQASSVYCAYRRNEASMPGSKREVYKAKEEGVKFLWHYQPLEIIGSEQVEAVRFARTKIVVDALTQRNILEIDERDEVIIPADAVVIAFGFQPHEINWLDRYNIQTDEYGRIQTNIAINDHGESKTKNVSEANAVNGATEAIEAKKQKRFAFQTHNDKIFAGGDITRGSDLVVTAIFEGRSAARGIISYLSE